MAANSKTKKLDAAANTVEVPFEEHPVLSKVDHRNIGVSCIGKLYETSEMSDVCLVVGDERYHAHRLLLASASSVFRHMLTSDRWSETKKLEVQLVELPECMPVFGSFLRYLYTRCIILTTQDVLPLFILADKYDIPDLGKSCSSYMKTNIAVGPEDNRVITWYQHPVNHDNKVLLMACFSYMKLNMDTIINAPDWIDLERITLVVLLSSSDIIIHNEYVLLRAVIRWVTHESRLANREENFTLLLQSIRFPMIPPEHIAEFRKSDIYTTYEHLFAPHIIEAFQYHVLSARDHRQHCGFEKLSGSQVMYRNYTDAAYSICCEMNFDNLTKKTKSESTKGFRLDIPMLFACPRSHRKLVGLLVFFPKGYTKVPLSAARSLTPVPEEVTDDILLAIEYTEGDAITHFEISFILYSKHGDVDYAALQINKVGNFKGKKQVAFRQIVSKDKLYRKGSLFLRDDCLRCKVFVRPIESPTAAR